MILSGATEVNVEVFQAGADAPRVLGSSRGPPLRVSFHRGLGRWTPRTTTFLGLGLQKTIPRVGYPEPGLIYSTAKHLEEKKKKHKCIHICIVS